MRLKAPEEFLTGAETHVDEPRCRQSGVTHLVTAVCAEAEKDWNAALKRGVSNWQTLSGSSAVRLHLMLEGSEPLVRLEDSRALLEDLEMATLTWNHANSLAGGVASDQGLTEEGGNWIRRFAEAGVTLDISHLCARSRGDVLRLHQGILVASHCNAAGIFDHPRNLPDQDLREIARRGGVVGITFVPHFLGPEASLETIVDHIAYVADLVGVKSVALGSDFDGIGRLPRGIRGCQSWPDLIQRLEKRGFSDSEKDAIAFGNWTRVLGADGEER